MTITMFFNLLNIYFFSPLEQFEVNSYNTKLSSFSTYNLSIFEFDNSFNFWSNISYQTIFSTLILIYIFGLVIWLQIDIKQKGFLFLFVFIYILLVGFNEIKISDYTFQSLNIVNRADIVQTNKFFQDLSNIYGLTSADNALLADENAQWVQLFMVTASTGFFQMLRYFPLHIVLGGDSGCSTGQCESLQYIYQIEEGFDYFWLDGEANREAVYAYLFNNVHDASPVWNAFFYLNNAIVESTAYFTIISSSFNIYSVFFCFVFIYVVIYLLYNKMISSHSNTLIPNMYQALSETLYKVSLNLFYSILGKSVTIPEFFIKINTIFIFLIISNLQGMIPYMSTLTSTLTNTFFIALALFISILTTLFDKKGVKYFLNLFMPSGCPLLLSLLIIPIEVISYSFRLVSLSVRLFANMMAGHTLLKVIVGFSWVIIFLGNTFFVNLFPILILMILTLLEFGVALIQAYIFTVLSCIYLRDIFEGH